MDSDTLLNEKLRKMINNISYTLTCMEKIETLCSDALKINSSTNYKNSVMDLEYSLRNQRTEMREIRNKLSS